MTLAGLLPLIKLLLDDPQANWPYDLAVLGFFSGATLLPALSFRHAVRNSAARLAAGGLEDAHSTWSKKMLALALAILTASFIVCSLQAASGILAVREVNAVALEPALLLIVIVCSGAYWAMVARSIFGAIILPAIAQFGLYLLLVVFVRAIDAMAPGNPYANRISHAPEVHAALLPFVWAFGLSYAALMLWLGRKRFAAGGRKTAATADMVS
ncbi:MAG TPA: hypothetical protein VJ063_07540 [Verrucomicrobiae bacterium]|nr:hypothetical protein [Verrucomicrobiae bacterium]